MLLMDIVKGIGAWCSSAQGRSVTFSIVPNSKTIQCAFGTFTNGKFVSTYGIGTTHQEAFDEAWTVAAKGGYISGGN